MEQELTVEELIAEFGEEADSCDREERLQT